LSAGALSRNGAVFAISSPNEERSSAALADEKDIRTRTHAIINPVLSMQLLADEVIE
jgi:hypothetical protein